MSRELEKLVKDANKVRTLRQAASTTYHGLMTMQGSMEETMTDLLKENNRVGSSAGYYAKLVREQRGTQGVPYKQVYVTEKITRVDYGKIEKNK